MENILSIVGLLLTSAPRSGSQCMTSGSETNKGTNRCAVTDWSLSDAMLGRYQEVRTNLESATESLDPAGQHQRYSVEEMTKAVRADFETAERKLAEAESA